MIEQQLDILAVFKTWLDNSVSDLEVHIRSQLKVFEAVCIRLLKPDFCKQKKRVVALRLFS